MKEFDAAPGFHCPLNCTGSPQDEPKQRRKEGRNDAVNHQDSF